MKMRIASMLACLLAPLALLAQETYVEFGGTSDFPYAAKAVVKSVDFETTQNIDIVLPQNFRYKLEAVEVVVRTAPSAVTTAAKVGVSEYDGTTATEVRGDVSLVASTAASSDVLFTARGSGGGYVYYQNIVAAGTTGLCTQNTALNSAGALAGEVSPDVPRKLVLTLVDNAGDDLAGTVTLTGLNVEGEEITEVVTVEAGTVSYTTENVFATFTAGTFDFGETGEATNDTLDIGQGAAIGLPSKNAVPVLVISTGSVETPSATDPAQGALTFTDTPDGASDYEVWFRQLGNPYSFTGGNKVRLSVTGSTVTGSDVRDVFVYLTKY